MLNLEVHLQPEQKQDKQEKPNTNNNTTILTYNVSSTWCGLGILYPSWSKFAIFLPSIREYGEPPELE